MVRLAAGKLPPGQGLAQRQHLTAVLRGIAGNLRQLRLPVGALQQAQQGAHGGLLQRRFQAHQVVVFAQQGHEIEALALRRDGNAQGGVGLGRGHGVGYRRVRGFALGAHLHLGFAQPGLGQKLLLQQARAAAVFALHQARAAAGHVGQAAQLQRVARRDDQSLGALRKADDLVLAGLQQRFVDLRGQRVAGRLRLGVEAGEHAAPFVQGADGVHAAAEADVQVQPGARRQRQQRSQRVVVAGVERGDLGGGVEGDGKGAFEFGLQGRDLRRQPCLGLAFGPEQLGGKRRQARRLALVPEHQRLAQLAFPALEFAPDVAVGQSQGARRSGDRALGVHRLQQVEQRVAYACRTGGAGEGVVELEPMHGCAYRGMDGGRLR